MDYTSRRETTRKHVEKFTTLFDPPVVAMLFPESLILPHSTGRQNKKHVSKQQPKKNNGKPWVVNPVTIWNDPSDAPKSIKFEAHRVDSLELKHTDFLKSRNCWLKSSSSQFSVGSLYFLTVYDGFLQESFCC